MTTIDRAIAEEKTDKARELVQQWGQKMRQQQSWPLQAWHDLGIALQLVREAIEYDRNYQRPWILLADIFHRIGNKELAEKSLKKSHNLALSKQNPGQFYESVKQNITSGYPFNAAGNLKREVAPPWFMEKYQRYFVLDPVTSLELSNPNAANLRHPKSSIFISYSRSDWADWVKPLVERLQEESLSVWVDQHLLRGGQDWLDEINNALDKCAVLILCVSSEAINSKYVKMEYRYFLDENKPVIPVICQETKLPAELRQIQYLHYKDVDKLIELLISRNV